MNKKEKRKLFGLKIIRIILLFIALSIVVITFLVSIRPLATDPPEIVFDTDTFLMICIFSVPFLILIGSLIYYISCKISMLIIKNLPKT